MATKTRKLTATMRKKLKIEALHRFIDVEKREAEILAADAFMSGFMDHYDNVIAKELPVARRHTNTRVYSCLYVDVRWAVKKKDKVFNREDGKVVVRKDVERKSLPSLTINEYANGRSRCAIENNSRLIGFDKDTGNFSRLSTGDHYALHMELPRGVELVSNRFASSLEVAGEVNNNFHEYHVEDPVAFTALTPLIIDALTKAADRIESEAALADAIFAVIDNARSFEELLTVWPEAAEMEEDLFPNSPKATALSIVNEEKIALLCGNMKSRGVDSTVCDIAA